MLSHHGNCLSQQFDMFGEHIVAVPLQQCMRRNALRLLRPT